MSEEQILMTPAAIAAAAKGDFGNFMVAATPGGIEAQEKRGQLEQAEKQTLPRRMMGCTREDFEKLGFKFGENVDGDGGIFVEAVFPTGWKKVPTDHSMWSKLVDVKGRERGSIFYKAAFYDLKAHVDLSPRFKVRDNCYDEGVGDKAKVFVEDACGKVTHAIGNLKNHNIPAIREDRKEWQKRYDAIQEAGKKIAAWLDKKYPKWREPLAYWED
jgi:hypothetical protein